MGQNKKNPFKIVAFIRLDDGVNVDTLIEGYMNEYGVLGYGAHLAEELAAFCDIMGIEFVRA